MPFDYKKFKELQDVLKKQGQFVPMDPGAGGPPPEDAGMAGGPPPDPSMMAGGPPPDPSMMGGDPAAMGMPPPDPSMMGGDPAAAMGMPPPPAEDPAAGGDVSPSGEPYMKITPTQLSKLFKQFAEVFKSVLGIGGQQGQVAQAAPAPQVDPGLQAKMTEIDAKLNALIGG